MTSGHLRQRDQSGYLRRMAELTVKQENFAKGVAASLSYADAYRAAYNCGPNSPWVGNEAWKLKCNPAVARKIAELQKATAAKLDIKRADLVRWHLARMSYNPDELIKTVAGACRHCHGEGFRYQWRVMDYFEELAKAEADAAVQSKRGWRALPVALPDIGGGFGYNATRNPHPDCPKCDGKGISRTVVTPAADLTGAARAAYEGVKETANGIEVKMADKHASSVEVAKLLGFNVERAPIDINEEVPDTDISALDTAAVHEVYRKMLGNGRNGTRTSH
jgi:phage terminase small subunit